MSERFRAHVEELITTLQRSEGGVLAFDRQSLAQVDDYIARLRPKTQLAELRYLAWYE